MKQSELNRYTVKLTSNISKTITTIMTIIMRSISVITNNFNAIPIFIIMAIVADSHGDSVLHIRSNRGKPYG